MLESLLMMMMFADFVVISQDKCIKKNVVRNIVEAAAIRDLNEASVYDSKLLVARYCTLMLACHCVGGIGTSAV